MTRGKIRSTTVLAVRRGGHVVLGGDGQVTMGNTVVKASARKIRRLGDGRIVAGFAGSAADGITLFEKFESRLKEYGGNLTRAAVELAKDWRTDRVLRRLEALLLVADREKTLLLSGTGDVIEPDSDAAAVGSGGPAAVLSRGRGHAGHVRTDTPFRTARRGTHPRPGRRGSPHARGVGGGLDGIARPTGPRRPTRPPPPPAPLRASCSISVRM